MPKSRKISSSLHRQRLAKLLTSADLIGFLKMIWSVDALTIGNSSNASKYFEFPAEAVSARPGSDWYIARWLLETLVNEYFFVPPSNRPPRRLLSLPVVCRSD